MVGRQRERRRVLSSDRMLYRAWVHTRDVSPHLVVLCYLLVQENWTFVQMQITFELIYEHLGNPI